MKDCKSVITMYKNSRILLLKTEKLSDFLRQGSKLFHSIMVNGKKR